MIITVKPGAAPDNASLLDEWGEKMLPKIRQKHWKERLNESALAEFCPQTF